jgi:hypothetical protein
MKILGVAFGLLGIIQVLIYGYYEDNFLSYPQSPDPSSGRVVPHLVKATTRYVSSTDLAIVEITEAMGAACAILFLVCGARYLALKRKDDYSI